MKLNTILLKLNRTVLLVCVGLFQALMATAQPAITSFSPTTGAVGTLVTITGTNLSSSSSLSIGGVPAIVISNTSTTIVGLTMPGATTGIISVTTSGGTANSGSSFTVNTSQPPSEQIGSKMVGTGTVGNNSQQGNSIAVSADGNTSIVGGTFDDGNVGATWVFIRSGGVWSQQGSKLVGTGSVGESLQGKCVAVSEDGNTAVVGGPGNNNSTGSVWVFIRSGGVWSQQSQLIASGISSFTYFGTSLSLSADGNTLVIGGNGDTNYTGAAWIFTRSGSVWTQQSKLVGSGTANNTNQGKSVALSFDGNTAIVGGTGDNSNAGAAWVYTRSGGVWTQQDAKLVGTGAVGLAQQGSCVYLSDDGNTAIIGGEADNTNVGAAWVFTRSGGVWSQQGSKLVGSGAVGQSQQGTSVSLSSDGNTAVIGGSSDDNGNGAIWIFTRSGSVWSQQGSKLVGSGAVGIAYQGKSVSLSNDGNTAILGGTNDAAQIGASWVFTRSGGVWSQQGSKLVGNEISGPAGQGVSVAISANGNLAIVGGDYDGAQVGAAWVYALSNGSWVQQNKLVGSGPIGQSQQGFSVALAADGNTAILGAPGDNGSTGAAWIFVYSAGTWTQQAKLIGTGSSGNSFHGKSVSLSADGNTAIVGGSGDNNYTGAVWIYTRSGGVWTQQGSKLVSNTAVGQAQQGIAVALSANGNNAIVGGSSDDINKGAAWIYTRSGNVWTEQSKLVASGIASATFHGASVAISANGNTAIVGGHGDNGNIGASWVYTRSGSVWSQQSKLVDNVNTANARQGTSVAISADGNTVVIGARGYNSNNGASWIYTRSGSVWTKQNILEGTGSIAPTYWWIPGVQQGITVCISANGNTTFVGGPGDANYKGAVWVFKGQQAGAAINFDGVDDRISVSSPVNLPTGNDHYTIEGWIKPVNNTQKSPIAGWGTFGTTNAVNAFRTTDAADGGAGGLINSWWGNDLFVAPSGFNLFDGEWHHVAATFDGTTRKIYVDGTLRGQDTPVGNHTVSATNFNIGRSNNTEYFRGDMDEVRIWSRALCAYELLNNMNSEIGSASNTGLALSYSLNQGIVGANNSGISTVTDNGANNNNGTLAGFSLTGTTSNWSLGTVTSAVSEYVPTTLAGTAGGASVTNSLPVNNAGTFFMDNSCNAIAKVIPSGGTPVTGSITSKVIIDASVQSYNSAPYVQRHYDIDPAVNAANATGTITLYYTQAEFNAYNAVRGAYPALPTGSGDAAGIANIRISQYHGTGTAPGNYTGSTVVLDPNDANIVWNSATSRWEVTFTVSGFSGFYLRTVSGGPLPVTLINFSGSNSGTINKLQWKTSSEQNSDYFDLERSTDGINYIKVATLAAQGNSNSEHHYENNDNISGLSNTLFYYRLKMVDQSGVFKYSAVVRINTSKKGFEVTVSPNPFADIMQININSTVQEQAKIRLIDNKGQIVWQHHYLLQKGSNALLMPQPDALTTGLYYLQIQTLSEQQTVKVIKR